MSDEKNEYARPKRIEEEAVAAIPGIPMLVLGLMSLVVGGWLVCHSIVALFAENGTRDYTQAYIDMMARKGTPVAIAPPVGWGMPLVAALFVLVAVLTLSGLVTVRPNVGVVTTFFGRYTGTLSRNGYWWINPFLNKAAQLSLALKVLEGDHVKVNDLNGNPVELGAVVTWSVTEPAQAFFGVESYERFVNRLSETVIRTVAATHPYEAFAEPQPLRRRGAADASDAGVVPAASTGPKAVMTLRGHDEEVSRELRNRLGKECQAIGVGIHNVQISHLAYAPEIASAMLRRQQALAVLSAQGTVLENAVGIIEKALDLMEVAEKDGVAVFKLDPERRAAMMSNLLTVMVGGQNATPVLNLGGLNV